LDKIIANIESGISSGLIKGKRNSIEFGKELDNIVNRSNRGGKRPNAGRKPVPDKKIQVSFSLRPVLVERLKSEPNKNRAIEKALCKWFGISLGE